MVDRSSKSVVLLSKLTSSCRVTDSVELQLCLLSIGMLSARADDLGRLTAIKANSVVDKID